jgi:hypothetical protein
MISYILISLNYAGIKNKYDITPIKMAAQKTTVPNDGVWKKVDKGISLVKDFTRKR